MNPYSIHSRAMGIFWMGNFIRTRLRLASMALFLALVFPAVAQAQLTTDSDGNGGLIITGYNDFPGGALVIPASIGGLPVTSIGDYAFYVCNGLTSVSIPAGVTNIGTGAFAACTSLTVITVDSANPAFSSVSGVLFDKSHATLLQYPAGIAAGSFTIPNSVTSIGTSAFNGCANLTSVSIPTSVTSIGGEAFSFCSGLNDMTIPTSVVSLGNGAFDNCYGLTSVKIPSSVASMGDYVFENCSALTAITVDPSNPNYSNNVEGVLFNKDQTTLEEYPAGRMADNYTIPSSVTSIENDAFESCANLTSVTIPNSVTSIGDFAFSYCTGLLNVTIPSSVTTIGFYVFDACDSLMAITVDPSNPNYRSTGGVFFDKNQTTLLEYPAGSTASTYTMPASVTSIAGFAFHLCSNLTSITIPAGVTNIGDSAFENCFNLTTAIFDGNAPTLGDEWDSSDFAANLFLGTDDNFTVYYQKDAVGFTSPTWDDGAGDTYQSAIFGTDAFNGQPLSDDWKYSPIFGIYNTADYPWVYRTDLGFVYVETTDNTDLYLYVVNGNMGWLYTTSAIYPFYFSFTKNSWLYFGGGTSFYNYTTHGWETY